MDLDLGKLNDELATLNRARIEISERLRTSGPAPPRPAPPRPAALRQHLPRQDDFQGEYPVRQEEPVRRPNVQSVVAHAEDRGPLSSKRPAGEIFEEQSDVKRRNKRLFGAILGTLQRFSREEEQSKGTAAAQRRAEVEKRADDRKMEASRALRQQARDEMRQHREGEVARRRDISAQAACKRLEIIYATKLARADKLASRFLLTKTGPPLYYCPGKPCREIEALGEEQRQAHLQWKAAQLEQLEQEKTALMAQLTQRRQWGHGDHPAGEGPAADEEMEEEAEEMGDDVPAAEPAQEREERQDEEHQQEQEQQEPSVQADEADAALVEPQLQEEEAEEAAAEEEEEEMAEADTEGAAAAVVAPPEADA